MATWNTDKPALANQVSDDVPDIEENFQELHDVIEQLCNGTLGTTEPANFDIQLGTASRVVVTDASKDLTVSAATAANMVTLTDTSDADALHAHDLKADLAVYKTIYIPAQQLVPTTTNGATLVDSELGTNDIQIEYLTFDGATEQFACCDIVMPDDYDTSVIRAKFYWLPGAATCTAGDTVEWEFTWLNVSNDDVLDPGGGMGAPQVISDVVLAGKDTDLHITDTTPTIAVTYTLGDLLHIKISRNVGGTDDMAEDAWLLGVLIQYKTLTTTPAVWS